MVADEKPPYKEVIEILLANYDREELREITKVLNGKLHKKATFKTCLACDSRLFKLTRKLSGKWIAICGRCKSHFTLAELHLRMIHRKNIYKKIHKYISYEEYLEEFTKQLNRPKLKE
ncbi:hypothetical protein KAR91_84440 [Candidatus Pacearchaeota archaeon]|nr:hypothetical protein [Candidatus Pacearchaeota archaeon]